MYCARRPIAVMFAIHPHTPISEIQTLANEPCVSKNIKLYDSIIATISHQTFLTTYCSYKIGRKECLNHIIQQLE